MNSIIILIKRVLVKKGNRAFLKKSEHMQTYARSMLFCVTIQVRKMQVEPFGTYFLIQKITNFDSEFALFGQKKGTGRI